MLVSTAVLAWVTCVLVQGAVLAPLVRARGIRCITALLLIIASASLTTLTIQFVAGSLTPATFSLPAFYSGLLLASALLLLVPSVLLLGLSSLLLVSLLSSFLSTCLLYIYSCVPVLGFEYDADSALHFSALVLSTLVGACGIGCLLVAVAGRLTSEEGEQPSKAEALPVIGAETSDDDAYVDIDTLQTEEVQVSEQYSLNHQTVSTSPALQFPFSSFSSSTLCWPLSISFPSVATLVSMSSRQLSRASVRLGVGFVTSLLSALLYCLHLIPIYATQRAGVLRMISLDPYLLSIHLGLCIVAFTVCPLLLYTYRALYPQGQSLFLSPRLTGGCCLGGALAGVVYWWSLGYMPAHAHIGKDALVAEYEWYFYSSGSDALAVAAQTVPRITLTALAWAVAKEHKVPVPATPQTQQLVPREEMQEINTEQQEDVREQQHDEEEAPKAALTRVSGSTVALWCLALVLGAVSDGVAVFAWDEGY